MEHTSDELTSDRFSGNANHDLKTRALKETEYFLQDTVLMLQNLYMKKNTATWFVLSMAI